MTTDPIHELILDAADTGCLFLPHAIRQMARPDRMISADDVLAAIQFGEVIEDYPEDPRGHSALVAHVPSEGRPLHVVCSPKVGYLAIITAYVPDPLEWTNDFRRRLRR